MSEKSYAYFPGCSLEKMAHSYHTSTLETGRVLGIEFRELEDWNCCGATAYFHVDEILAATLCARNLAMAEKMGLDLVAPCSGCYKNEYSANLALRKDTDLAEHINYALEADDLFVSGGIDVHHLMHVYVDGVGIDKIKEHVTHPLEGLRVAPYYGCQMVRPEKPGEQAADVEAPQYFEELIEAMGAEAAEYPLKLRCCGGSLIATGRDAALTMVHNLLQNAVDNDADVIATACPLCQINLECYQNHVNQELGSTFSMPIMYFTQLLGLAMGIEPKRLEIGKEMVSTAPIVARAKPKAG